MNRVFTACRGSLLASLAVLVAAAPASAKPDSQSEIAAQREIFKSVFATVEQGNWSPVDNLSGKDRALLESYVLWPDLRALWLRANIRKVPRSEIDAFLQEYGTLKPARELRYRHALDRVRRNDLSGYLKIYEQFYQGQDIAKLDCLALTAELDANRNRRIVGRALDLWNIGKSQVAECDPVFAYLKANDYLGKTEYKKRFNLAIEAREFSLAKWLARSIDQHHVNVASGWQAALAGPQAFLDDTRNRADNESIRAQLAYAAERLTYRDPVAAANSWSRVSSRFAFSAARDAATRRHIALWMARDGLPGAHDALHRLPADAQDDEVHRWRARTSLQDANWERLLNDLDAMSAVEQQTEEWRYWRAVALRETGAEQHGTTQLASLSLERSYYGFLAADELNKDYFLNDHGLVPEESIIARLSRREDIIRARELFYVGQDGRGRSEWNAIMRYLDKDEKRQAAILADRWGWHSRAIATAAGLGEYDDLSLRYPLPYQATFEALAMKADVSPTWAYGIARSESLFMRDVKSRAGAVGLMQLMPATGREVAKRINLPYSGLATLTNPVANIRLGTSYLGEMSQRFDGNHVLATAAYNAGPHRVDQWLPKDRGLDTRAWIENIPFNETRDYVKRVLAAQTIFHWRMTGEVRRLTDALPPVVAANPEQLAAR